MTVTFSNTITTEEQLREVLGHPSEMAACKQIALIDEHARRFIERSPFALAGTSNIQGQCDISPRGDGPGFALVLDDHTLLLPERPGNKRGDTLTNILQNPHVGLLFLIPNVEETLRVNGRATIVQDQELLDRMAYRGKSPSLAIAVEIEELFFHCAKAFKRSGLWEPETWADQQDLPSLGKILLDQTKKQDVTLSELDASIEEAYRTKLY